MSAKKDGVTPGFTIRDSAGVVWFIKVDPPGYNGMATGTEVVVTKYSGHSGITSPKHISRKCIARI